MISIKVAKIILIIFSTLLGVSSTHYQWRYSVTSHPTEPVRVKGGQNDFGTFLRFCHI